MCNTSEMDYCYDRHNHKYLITYKPAPNGTRTPQWSVCDYCYETKKCFNDPQEVESVAILAA